MKKTAETSLGAVSIQTPSDHDGSFYPTSNTKRKKNISEIEDKILSIYARGMIQRDIFNNIEDIYRFSVSCEIVSDITKTVLQKLEE